jgi:hypothetical protein
LKTIDFSEKLQSLLDKWNLSGHVFTTENIQKLIDEVVLKDIKDKSKFSLKLINDSEDQLIELEATSEQERDLWVKAITLMLKNYFNYEISQIQSKNKP